MSSPIDNEIEAIEKKLYELRNRLEFLQKKKHDDYVASRITPDNKVFIRVIGTRACYRMYERYADGAYHDYHNAPDVLLREAQKMVPGVPVAVRYYDKMAVIGKTRRWLLDDNKNLVCDIEIDLSLPVAKAHFNGMVKRKQHERGYRVDASFLRGPHVILDSCSDYGDWVFCDVPT